jgi:hypothetical protein
MREYRASKKKFAKANENKVAFIPFHFLFQIEPFQCVTADKNEKIFAGSNSRLKLCAERRAAAFVPAKPLSGCAWLSIRTIGNGNIKFLI